MLALDISAFHRYFTFLHFVVDALKLYISQQHVVRFRDKNHLVLVMERSWLDFKKYICADTAGKSQDVRLKRTCFRGTNAGEKHPGSVAQTPLGKPQYAAKNTQVQSYKCLWKKPRCAAAINTQVQWHNCSHDEQLKALSFDDTNTAGNVPTSH